VYNTNNLIVLSIKGTSLIYVIISNHSMWGWEGLCNDFPVNIWWFQSKLSRYYDYSQIPSILERCFVTFPAHALNAGIHEGPNKRPEGGEWEPIKLLLQRENLAYTPIATRFTLTHKSGSKLGTHKPTRPRDKPRTKLEGLEAEANHKRQSNKLSAWARADCPHSRDRPRYPGGLSAMLSRTVQKSHPNLQ
jgi:hypothetical protein